jgi:hypothetical protein
MADDDATRLAALKRARDTGVLRVRHGDTSTTFRSLADINIIIQQLEGQAAVAAGGTPRTRLRYPIQTTKGL